MSPWRGETRPRLRSLVFVNFFAEPYSRFPQTLKNGSARTALGFRSRRDATIYNSPKGHVHDAARAYRTQYNWYMSSTVYVYPTALPS